jgi:hypothetical protein
VHRAWNLVFCFKVKPSEEASFPPVKQVLGVGRRDLKGWKALIELLVSHVVNCELKEKEKKPGLLASWTSI